MLLTELRDSRDPKDGEGEAAKGLRSFIPTEGKNSGHQVREGLPLPISLLETGKNGMILETRPHPQPN